MNLEAECAHLRRAFYAAVDRYPQHLAQFLSKEGEIAFRRWWVILYETVRDTDGGLKMLGEIQVLKDRVAELEGNYESGIHRNQRGADGTPTSGVEGVATAERSH